MKSKLTPSALAQEFSNQLKIALGEELFKEMVAQHIQENAVNEYHCVSHDYCDANVSMAEAFKTFTGKEPDTLEDNTIALWNKAWHLAKKKNFYSDKLS